MITHYDNAHNYHELTSLVYKYLITIAFSIQQLYWNVGVYKHIKLLKIGV
jgi:hypothetical protein